MDANVIECPACRTPVRYNPDQPQGRLSCPKCGEQLPGQPAATQEHVKRDEPAGPRGADHRGGYTPARGAGRGSPSGRDYYDDEPPVKKRSSAPWIILGAALVVVVVSCGVGGVGGLYYAVGNVRDSAARMQSQNNLKQIAIAMHNYHDANGRMVDDIRGPDGKPLLSWRVALLPYIEQDNLYKQFNLNEPWDSPNNSRMLNIAIKTYTIPGREAEAIRGLTFYQGFVGPGTVFDPKPEKPLKIGDVKDGTSNTFFVVEAADPVEWTKPGGLPFADGEPLPRLGGHYRRHGFNAALCDGSVRFVGDRVTEQSLRAAIKHSDGQVPGDDFFRGDRGGVAP